jgi:hypothetical protein
MKQIVQTRRPDAVNYVRILLEIEIAVKKLLETFCRNAIPRKPHIAETLGNL